MTTPERHSISGQSRPSTPEMDWSQIGESLAMLALAVAQIDSSLTEGSRSVNQLSSSFTMMADNTQTILKLASDEKSADEATAAKEQIASIAVQINEEIREAIVAFQFYDRLSQRLEHVSSSLERMGHLIADPSMRYSPNAWNLLQGHIKGKYTMEAERIMFEHIMAGNSVAEALEIYNHHFLNSAKSQDDTTDEIELF
ncbi:MAG: hypothetical protein ACPGYX_03210 [Oceanobacter sp.]